MMETRLYWWMAELRTTRTSSSPTTLIFLFHTVPLVPEKQWQEEEDKTG